jgi:saccharopine dehydrogenase-like NADP-dependent oxidoreductase
MIKVCVLGAGGGVGIGAVADLLESPDVSQVIACDIRIAEMKKYWKEHGFATKLSFAEVDLYDQQALVKAIKDCDVLLHCAGPFYKTAVPVANAAMEAKVNYCDICDDVEGTKALLDLDADAKQAGITMVTGFGADPGTANLLVKYASSKLDQVDKICVGYILHTEMDVGGDAVQSHMEHIEEGEVPQFLDGKLVYVPAGSGSEFLDLPEPFGRCEVHYIGHPETLTLPRYIKGVKEVRTVGGLVDYVDPADAVMIIDVEGKKEGSDISYRYIHVSAWCSFSGDIYYQKLIGCPPSIGAQLIGSGEINVPGSCSIEGCVEPEPFFDELRKRNIFDWQETITRRM